MRRGFACLKYLPAVLCGLLVVAWALSAFESIQVTLVGGKWLQLRSGSLWFGDGHWGENFEVTFFQTDSAFNPLGVFVFGRSAKGARIVAVPLVIIISIIAIPVLCVSFRFPLWSYFAWTALVAAELAYYLR
jgi:hypothetical protein